MLPNLPVSVDVAFRRALAKDREERPIDVETWLRGFLEELRRVDLPHTGWKTSPEWLAVCRAQAFEQSSKERANSFAKTRNEIRK
jgi:hypothetical protein